MSKPVARPITLADFFSKSEEFAGNLQNQATREMVLSEIGEMRNVFSEHLAKPLSVDLVASDEMMQVFQKLKIAPTLLSGVVAGTIDMDQDIGKYMASAYMNIEFDPRKVDIDPQNGDLRKSEKDVAKELAAVVFGDNMISAARDLGGEAGLQVVEGLMQLRSEMAEKPEAVKQNADSYLNIWKKGKNFEDNPQELPISPFTKMLELQNAKDASANSLTKLYADMENSPYENFAWVDSGEEVRGNLLAEIGVLEKFGGVNQEEANAFREKLNGVDIDREKLGTNEGVQELYNQGIGSFFEIGGEIREKSNALNEVLLREDERQDDKSLALNNAVQKAAENVKTQPRFISATQTEEELDRDIAILNGDNVRKQVDFIRGKYEVQQSNWNNPQVVEAYQRDYRNLSSALLEQFEVLDRHGAISEEEKSNFLGDVARGEDAKDGFSSAVFGEPERFSRALKYHADKLSPKLERDLAEVRGDYNQAHELDRQEYKNKELARAKKWEKQQAQTEEVSPTKSEQEEVKGGVLSAIGSFFSAIASAIASAFSAIASVFSSENKYEKLSPQSEAEENVTEKREEKIQSAKGPVIEVELPERAEGEPLPDMNQALEDAARAGISITTQQEETGHNEPESAVARVEGEREKRAPVDNSR